MCFKNGIKEKTISTMDELLSLINEYSDKKLYFRGENKNYEKTACLPQFCRKNACLDINNEGDKDKHWFTEKLENLGVGTPYIPCKSNGDNVLNTLINLTPHCWMNSWGNDKYEALIQHYADDFNKKDKFETDIDLFLKLFGARLTSRFLDITSDIMVALHFACSRHLFYLKKEEIPSESETIEDGYLFVFDLCGIENAKCLRLVSYPSYTYFYKDGSGFHFQPFDRITHQKGSFLAPKAQKMDKKIEYCIFETEIKNHISEKIILKSEVKKELYKIFGSEKGLDYYFPKIPLSTSKNTDIEEAYENMKGFTILE